MSNPKGLLQSLSCLVLFVTTAAAATGVVFQPALTGFRCEGSNEVTPDGIAIIEADIPVRVTLFGESFTTETIVGFTTEYAPKVDTHNQIVSFNERDKKAESSYRQANRLTSHNQTTSNETRGSPTVYDLLEEENNNNNNNNNKQTESQIEARKHQRRLLDAKRHDCTDFDRVISYRLQEDNIITPNVAVLTIRLPELELASGSGMYYYFCVKQPPMMTGPMYDGQVGPSGGGDSSSRTAPAATQRGLNGTSNDQRRELVWVHQGNEWWLMIKVEPPILSIANDCVLIVLLLFLSAVSSGLNLGLMSLDMNELAVISSCGDPRERSYARTIMPLRKRGNYLLCALLLGNVMVNSTLTVILEEMTSGLVAIIGSTLAIVILGEIVPQAFCARRGLAIGAKTIYLTYGFMLITFPLSYPISCLLDCALGEEKGNVYDRERLMEFIRITGNHTQLEADEVAIISGALKLKKIKVDQIMTKIEDVFMLPIDCMLDRKTIKSIIEKGYSRIPVYEFGDRRQIVALILAKDLALLDPDDQMPLASMLMYCKHPLVFIEDTATLDVALNEFKTGKSHMAIVRQIYDDGEVDKYYESIGVVTLEDVIEEVLQTEINDETDTLSDNRRKRRRTDAQVSHLVDELLSDCSSSPGGLAALAPTLSLSSAKPNNNNNNL